jgi:hypothetical protein
MPMPSGAAPAAGLYVLPDGSVMVAYGLRHIPISCAQYRANGHKPALEKLPVAKSLGLQKARVRPPSSSAARTKGRSDGTPFAQVP